jgi:LPXTG-motif cell wall-anchored protein
MIETILLDLMPDPEFYQKTSFWVLTISALAAITGLIIWFVRRKKNQ